MSTDDIVAPDVLASIEVIIDEARNGRMFILVDDKDRENEGDLVIPAQMATPDAINFMATHGRGLICLALAPDRIEQLGLHPMSRHNGTRHETAFTVSIEARDGVTTGISASDRARTIAVAIDASKGPEHIVTPGHVFPLAAKPGGVLVRAGHTEAAVDVSRLAGLNRSGVICEIMNDDGTMARLADLVTFARQHGLKIGTIRDLIAYRRRHDDNIEKVSEMPFDSHYGGHWRAIAFRSKAGEGETLALIKGKIDPTQPTLVRMHALSLMVDALGEEGERRGLLQNSMRMIDETGAGVVVIIYRATSSRFSLAMLLRQPEVDLETIAPLRDYGIGAQVLARLGVHDMILLTNGNNMPVALAGYGLNIVEKRAVPVDSD